MMRPRQGTIWLLVLATCFLVGCSDEPKPSNRETKSETAPGVKPQRQLPNLEVLGPSDSIAATELPFGYALEVVLAEPQIEEPVLVAWDGNGRMYVAEMRSFMQDVDGKKQLKPVSRILRFEDSNDDGEYDRRTIYADNLVLPRALLPLDNRLLVMETNSRNILSFLDSNQDGIADSREIAITIDDVENRNLEHQDANLLWNIDNWIYSCQGGLRHRLNAKGEWQREKILSEQNQWGLTQDDTGQMFFADNTRPARDFQQHWYYWNLLGNDFVSAAERELVGPNLQPSFLEVWPLIKTDDAEGAETELREDGTLKQFTCACGQHIYRGDALPRLKGNLFVCEPVGRLIRRGTIRGQTSRKFIFNEHKKSEFLRSKDFFFRPVHLDTGPDGHLYIVDMNRGIIQESAWLVEGSSIRRVIESKGLDRVKRRGRILRVIPKRGRKKTTSPRMLDESSIELVRHLEHPNGWWRDTAQKLLVLRGDLTVVQALKTLVQTSKLPLARLHALWTLDGLDAMDLATLEKGSRDADWKVRAASVRLSEPWLKRGHAAAFAFLRDRVTDSNDKVLQQAILSLALGEKNKSWSLADTFIRQNWNVDLVRMAAITGFQQSPLRVFKDMESLKFFDKAPNKRPLRENPRAVQNKWLFSLRYQFGARRGVHKYRTLDATGEKILHRGSLSFEHNCVMCHGADAKGAIQNGKRMGAKLSDSDRVLGNPEGLVLILLHGLRGQINGEDIGVMIPYASQTDQFIADTLSALRWSQRRAMIKPEFVALIRERHSARRSAWTLAELGHFAPSQFRPKQGFRISAHQSSATNLAFINDNSLVTQEKITSKQKVGDSIELAWDKPHEVSYLVIDSGDSKDKFARAFKVEVALNDGPWQEVGRLEAGIDLVQELKLEPTLGTKLKITITAANHNAWVIHELSLFGCSP